MKTAKNIPELRFPEFEGEWKSINISESGRFIGGGTPESNHIEYWQGSIPWISSSDIMDDNIHDIKITRHITEEAVNDSATKRIPEYSVLIVSRVGIGKFAVNKQELCTSQDFTNLIPLSDNSFFLAYTFTARQKRFLRLSQGTSIKGFTGEDIGNLKFYVPDLPEQQKIASFLASVDQRIHLLTQKKEKLEQYKKGVLQRIFSQELRFKDENGQDYPEWEVKRLGDIGTILKGKGISKDDITIDGHTECIRYGELYTFYRETIYTTISKTNRDPKELILSKKHDVIIPASGETQIDIAKASCVMRDGIALGGDLNIIRTDIDGVYLTYYINGALKYEIAKAAQGISVIHLYGSQLKELRIKLPNDAEQQKIATFLSSLDVKIAQVNSQLELTRKWKKGLLQKMFV